LLKSREKYGKILDALQNSFDKEIKAKTQVINWLAGGYSVEK
jgi:hypothetical protein